PRDLHSFPTRRSSDLEHMILPNVITYPGIIFALLTRVLVPYIASPSHFDDLPQLMTAFPTLPLWAVSLIGAAIGAVAGGGSLWRSEEHTSELQSLAYL